MIKLRIKLFLAGVIFLLVLVELLLWCVPELLSLRNDPLSPLTICNSKELYQVHYFDKKDNKLIAVFGDSLTYGLGADKGFSEPEQLEKLIRHDGKSWQVDNLGYPAINTLQMKIRLKKYLEVNQPDLILLRGGSPNYWNSSLNPKGYFFKTWILIKKLSYSLKKESGAQTFLPLAQELESNKSITSLNFDLLPEEERTKKEFERACVLWEKQTIFTLGDEIVKKIKSGQYSRKNYYALPLCLQRIYHREGAISFNTHQLEQLKNNIHYSLELMPEYSLVMNRYSPKEVEDWIYKDMSDIVSYLKKKGIALVIVGYPPDLKYSSPEANKILRKVALDHAVPYIDTESRFFELYKKGEKQEDYHAMIGGKLDMHLNNRGYGISAVWTYTKLKEFKLIN